MKAKQYLSQLQTICIKIGQKKEELERLKSLVQVRGMQTDSEHVQTSPQNVQENTILSCIDLQSEVRQTILLYINKRDRIVNQIHELDDSRYVRILYERYVPGSRGKTKTLREIQKEMDYSYDRICHMHGEALCEFQKILDKESQKRE